MFVKWKGNLQGNQADSEKQKIRGLTLEQAGPVTKSIVTRLGCPCQIFSAEEYYGKMMAVCKYWFEKYGAVPVTISHNVMEMQLPKPVAEKDSMQAAKEHFAFTPDRVFQCTKTGTLAEVAACIAASEIGYFWWD